MSLLRAGRNLLQLVAERVACNCKFIVLLQDHPKSMAALHEESTAAPLEQRRGIGLMLALRRWEPESFKGLRRAYRSKTAVGVQEGAL